MSRKCIEEGCTTSPSYNIEGQIKRLYCSIHGKEKGMINIKSKKCEHNKFKSICKECSSSAFCEHNKRKRYCKECDGSAFCKHDKFKSYCKDCGGVSICEHNKQKSKCKYCRGVSICQHNIEKSQCKDCGGSAICEHKKRKSYCKDCHGSSICKHNKFKSLCKECDGSAFCEHNKFKSLCKDCGGSGLCKSSWCSTQVRKKYDGYCLYCYMNLFPDKPVARNYKTKEYSVVEYIKTTFSEFDWTADKKVRDGCSRRRPDLLLDLGYQIIIVEIDENQHIDYDCSCENKRIMELSQDVGHRPIVFIRFNPDDYMKETKNVTSCWGLDKKGICGIKKSKKKEWDERLKALEEQIKYWTDPLNKTEKTIEVIQLFYDTE